MRIITAPQFFLWAVVALFSSCSFFQRPPPLPRRAAIEPRGTQQEFANLVEGADIIYFPSEAVTFASRADPAWKLLGALRGGGDSFAIGWDWSRHDARDFVTEAADSGAETIPLNETDQVVAEKIASYFREHRNGKVLVFIRRDRLGLGQGVPYLVAQQTKARQLILNPRKSSAGARLLAWN